MAQARPLRIACERTGLSAGRLGLCSKTAATGKANQPPARQRRVPHRRARKRDRYLVQILRASALVMRHATWLRLEASPFWHDLYRQYRRLPDSVRAPLRALMMPHWHLAARLVRMAARHEVVAGPFRGMKIQLSPLSSRHLLGYILGSQELELREVIGRIIERGYGTIINVGGADGYYAVGLARRSPSSRVEAFETLGELHPLIESSARLNGVSARITLRGMCDANALRQSLESVTPPALVVMDIEGGEVGLLDPRSIPQLRHADILVE